jgi:hypothetical protein
MRTRTGRHPGRSHESGASQLTVGLEVTCTDGIRLFHALFEARPFTLGCLTNAHGQFYRKNLHESYVISISTCVIGLVMIWDPSLQMKIFLVCGRTCSDGAYQVREQISLHATARYGRSWRIWFRRITSCP